MSWFSVITLQKCCIPELSTDKPLYDKSVMLVKAKSKEEAYNNEPFSWLEEQLNADEANIKRLLHDYPKLKAGFGVIFFSSRLHSGGGPWLSANEYPADCQLPGFIGD